MYISHVPVIIPYTISNLHHSAPIPLSYTHPIPYIYPTYIYPTICSTSITAHLKFQQTLGPNVTTTLIPDSAVGRYIGLYCMYDV